MVYDGGVLTPGEVAAITTRRDDARRVYYDRTDRPLWKIIQAAADVIEPG